MPDSTPVGAALHSAGTTRSGRRCARSPPGQMRPMHCPAGLVRKMSAPRPRAWVRPCRRRTSAASAARSSASATVTRMSASFGSGLSVVSVPIRAIPWMPATDRVALMKRKASASRNDRTAGPSGHFAHRICGYLWFRPGDAQPQRVRRPRAPGAAEQGVWPCPKRRIRRTRIPGPASQRLRTAALPRRAGPVQSQHAVHR